MDEVLNALILASLDRMQPGIAVQLCRAAGGVQAVIDNRRDIRSIAPGAPQRVVDALADVEAARRRHAPVHRLRAGLRPFARAQAGRAVPGDARSERTGLRNRHLRAPRGA